MDVLGWIVLGFLAGSLAGLVTGHRDSGCISRIMVGIIGALLGGSLAHAAGITDVNFNTFTLNGLLVAIAGAALLLLVLEALSGKGRFRR